ncbi:MAG: DUF2079 domain-containing protein [Conexivisphaerales archaeon]
MSQKKSLQFMLFAEISIYVGVWATISILKFVSLDANIYDLGISVERAWQITHGSVYSFNSFLSILSTSGIVFFFAPLAEFFPFFTFLFIQTFFIAISSFVIFRIAIKSGLSYTRAFVISSVYLIYFPVAGINWFDFHYQAFFIPIFLLGYLFYLSNKHLLSILILFISGLVRFPFMLFPLLFSLCVLFGLFNQTDGEAFQKFRKYYIALFVISAIFLAAGFHYSNHIGTNILHNSNSIAMPVSLHIIKIFQVLIMIMAPLLFLPMVSKRWALFFIPFFALLSLSNNPYFYYPSLFHRQYASLFVAFIFLGAIDVLSYGNHPSKRKNLSKLQLRFVKGIRRYGPIMIVYILVTSLIMACFFEPYGPFNYGTEDRFTPISDFFNPSINRFAFVNYVVELIPQNQTEFTVIQNNIPQFLPRELGPGGFILDLPLTQFVNISASNFTRNNFSFVFNNQILFTKVNYILADSLNDQYSAGIISMEWFVNEAIMSGYYHIVYSYSGIELIERNS